MVLMKSHGFPFFFVVAIRPGARMLDRDWEKHLDETSTACGFYVGPTEMGDI